MSIEVAQGVINGSAKDRGVMSVQVANGTVVQVPRFNVSEMSYGEAVAKANSSGVEGVMDMMLGSVVGKVEAKGGMMVDVEAHGSRMFRLRAMGGAGVKRRDEL